MIPASFLFLFLTNLERSTELSSALLFEGLPPCFTRIAATQPALASAPRGPISPPPTLTGHPSHPQPQPRPRPRPQQLLPAHAKMHSLPRDEIRASCTSLGFSRSPTSHLVFTIRGSPAAPPRPGSSTECTTPPPRAAAAAAASSRTRTASMDLLSSLPPRDCKHPEIGLENRALVPSPLLIARETYNPLRCSSSKGNHVLKAIRERIFRA
ncbi:hypothetical protein Mp_8g14710 [Marchantia polymorpha subsp. ruderalis]|uniref:Uncharacterized protein n=1 Tax=Marchantia polymorpha TaxID=3197 RepID=A0A2R6W540_MARPO|nr:hypothetical protein MARPO_0151s0034 [Marchantia polymorpha]BBN19902.1 hypothetical protein Mp_8g14710 [Marchantia polymorpha subsp. ruderalis]|eukprot:PTQ28961.1 hypothetical protein MARPO_0151s0034 [Marchantia polymorpha]